MEKQREVSMTVGFREGLKGNKGKERPSRRRLFLRFLWSLVAAKSLEPWEPKSGFSLTLFFKRFIVTGAITVGSLWFLYSEASKSYYFHWNILWEYKGPFWQGFVVTLQVSSITLIFSILAGVLIGLARISRYYLLSDIAFTYVEVIRNIPLLVIIMLVYYGVGAILPMHRFPAAVVALTAFEASFIAEIVRGGIQSIGKGQTWAGRSLGFSSGQTMRYIILPQAVRRIIPALAGQFVTVIKDSSLVSVISLVDITLTGKQVMTTTMAALESITFIAFFYFVICVVLSFVTKYLERRLPVGD
jgi:polar amino acid transport system permease protein